MEKSTRIKIISIWKNDETFCKWKDIYNTMESI